MEADGVVARWFGRHECAAAIVRPDHYVFGVTTDAPSTAAMLSELFWRLQ
jgi:3-(3-hydroxy-phenyl)propionate hydroxylase